MCNFSNKETPLFSFTAYLDFLPDPNPKLWLPLTMAAGRLKLLSQISNTSGVEAETEEKALGCFFFLLRQLKEKKAHRKRLTPVLEEGEVVGSSLVKGLLSAQLDSAGKQEVPSPSGQNRVSSG